MRITSEGVWSVYSYIFKRIFLTAPCGPPQEDSPSGLLYLWYASEYIAIDDTVYVVEVHVENFVEELENSIVFDRVLIGYTFVLVVSFVVLQTNPTKFTWCRAIDDIHQHM